LNFTPSVSPVLFRKSLFFFACLTISEAVIAPRLEYVGFQAYLPTLPNSDTLLGQKTAKIQLLYEKGQQAFISLSSI
jgi:hypothetical protein